MGFDCINSRSLLKTGFETGKQRISSKAIKACFLNHKIQEISQDTFMTGFIIYILY